MSEIFYVKLVNGEDLITSVSNIDTEDRSVVFTQPMKVGYQRTESGGGSGGGFFSLKMYLTQWNPGLPNDIYDFPKTGIMCMYAASPTMIQYYDYMTKMISENDKEYDDMFDDETDLDNLNEQDQATVDSLNSSLNKLFSNASSNSSGTLH